MLRTLKCQDCPGTFEVVDAQEFKWNHSGLDLNRDLKQTARPSSVSTCDLCDCTASPGQVSWADRLEHGPQAKQLPLRVLREKRSRL